MHNRTARTAHTITAALAAASLSGCSLMSSFTDDGVASPLTPEQSRAQVVDAATDIVHRLQLTVVSANFSRASCNDQGDPPFRGEVVIFYPSKPNLEEANAEAEQMAQRLRNAGWTSDDSFTSHATSLQKNNVEVVFYPANASVPQGHIDLLGECRDVTTTKAQAGTMEDITFS
jgi:hypothetical protein